MRSVCVFCGSSPGRDPGYVEAARQLGELLASSGCTLVYGGGNIGLMRALADAALAHKGEVIGVIPQALLDREVAHRGVSQLNVVASMHERKALMAELSDGFIALPGGLGTLEELFEVWTWGQLGLHQKPCGLLNVAGIYSPLLEFIDQLVRQRFLREEHRDLLVVATQPDALLSRMKALHIPDLPRWIEPDQS